MFIRVFIKWLKWSMEKRGILIGSLSGPYFTIRTAKVKMDCSRTDFIDVCFKNKPLPCCLTKSFDRISAKMAS